MRILIAGKAGKTENYEQALRALGASCDVRLDCGDAGLYDGLLLPGGADIDPAVYGEDFKGSIRVDRSLDEAQLALFNLFLKAGKPILGICRGHQLVNVALGGTLIQNLQTADSHRRVVEGVDNHHMAEAASGSAMERLYGHEFRINSSHHQGCARIGKGLKVTLRASDGTVEALEHESLPIITVQWHPERTGFAFLSDEAVDGRKVFEHFLSLMKK